MTREYSGPGGAYGRAAYQVDRILNGSNPSELPVGLPTHFRLTVNLRTAQILGLTVSRGSWPKQRT
jgi:ABC-type uncharacterized transport system substrate-binding protein